MKTALLLLALVATIVSGQHRCRAPDQFTFRGNQANWGYTYYNRYFGQYDRYNQRVALFEESFVNGTKQYSRKYIFLHYEGAGYDYNLETKQCRHFKIGEFRPLEVPQDATFEGEVVIGGPEEQIIVDRWSDKLPGRRETWMGEFSLRTCYPISSFLVEDSKFNTTVLSYYYDIVVGLVNPNDFTVPAECRKSSLLSGDIPRHARHARAIYSRSLHF